MTDKILTIGPEVFDKTFSIKSFGDLEKAIVKIFKKYPLINETYCPNEVLEKIGEFEAGVRERIKELEKYNKDYKGTWGTDGDKELRRVLEGE